MVNECNRICSLFNISYNFSICYLYIHIPIYSKSIFFLKVLFTVCWRNDNTGLPIIITIIWYDIAFLTNRTYRIVALQGRQVCSQS